MTIKRLFQATLAAAMLLGCSPVGEYPDDQSDAGEIHQADAGDAGSAPACAPAGGRCSPAPGAPVCCPGTVCKDTGVTIGSLCVVVDDGGA